MTQLRIGLVGSGLDADVFGTGLELIEGVQPVSMPNRAESLIGGSLGGLVIAETGAPAVMLARVALEFGLPVFIVTPAGFTLEHIVEIRRAEMSEPGSILRFGLPLRHHPSVIAALDPTHSQRFGFLRSVRAVGAAPYPISSRRGAMNRFGVDMLDLLQAFTGPYEEPKAMISELPGSATGEDEVMALLRTFEGAQVSLHVSTRHWRPTCRVELNYERGFIWLEGLGHFDGASCPERLITADLGGDADAGDSATPPDEWVEEFPAINSTLAQLEGFVQLVRGGTGLSHGTSQQAFDAINIADRIMAADTDWNPTYGSAT